mmetsp:Transcript_13252/g.20726  ORF Transcript_13252/g.20726 Transcript_13252/m.20726 type:complete len:131 (+) Transcript_13252:997-1389(+)
MKIKSILNILNLILAVTAAVEVYRIMAFDLKDSVNWAFDVAFILAQASYMALFMQSMTMLAKLCSPMTRGTMFSFNSIFGSMGVLLIQLYGGYLYSTKGNKVGPFMIGLVGASINLVVTFVSGAAGKFKV